MYWKDGHLVVAARPARVRRRRRHDHRACATPCSSYNFSREKRTHAAPQPVVSIPLVDLLQKTFHAELPASGGNRISARRCPGDRLQVRLEGEHVIFRPGEVLDVNIHPHLLGHRRRDAAELDGLADIRRGKRRLCGATRPTSRLPPSTTRGRRFRFRSTFRKRKGFTTSCWNSADAISRAASAARHRCRKVQVVALSPQAPHRDLHHQAPTAPDRRNRSGESGLVETRSSRPCRRTCVADRWEIAKWAGAANRCRFVSELPPSVDAAGKPLVDDLSWQAYPLAVARPGTPHFLEIEYPSDAANRSA